MATADDKTINAHPTKEFFIYMLTKDIMLIRAIIDLIDNSWDGAIRNSKDISLDSMWIRVEISPTEFRISDNCGGIPYELAKNYAFRFGRPKEMPPTHHSVGQFGVGMKRSLFKLGNQFHIESKSSDSKFTITQNVKDWVKLPEWEFEFDSLELFQQRLPSSTYGTSIAVTDLHESVQTEFGSEIFVAQLKEAIQIAHQASINQGIAITLNRVPLTAQIAQLSQSNELKPANRTLTFDANTNEPVTVKMYAGISDSDPNAAGWNLFCNGRLILDSDGGPTTGWGEGNGRVIPRFHNQFARFRGYVFFDCDNAGKLPWNTTKTGVDSDSPIYQAVRQQMIEMMRPVIDFLNKLDAEKDSNSEDGFLFDVVEKTSPVALTALDASERFVAPLTQPAVRVSGPKSRVIKYSKPDAEVEAVKQALDVTTLKELGERTFDYFYQLECQ